MGLFQCLWCCCDDGWVVCARASEFPRDYDGACLQMRLSYGPAAHFFLFLVRWTDCSLAGALGLLRILIYKVLIVQNVAMMYKSHPHVMSCWPLHHFFFFFTSRKKDCFRVSVCILTSSNFVFCCNPPSLLGFVIVNIHLW